MKRLFIIMGILNALFGCNNRETIDPEKSTQYVRNTKTQEVFYKYYSAGNWAPTYAKLATNHPDDMTILGKHHATDSRLVFYRGDIIKSANPKGFQIHPEFSGAFAKDSIAKVHFYKDKILDLDYSTAKIHSKHYASDKDKVLYNGTNDSFSNEFPVEDIPSFAPSKKSDDSYPLAKDRFWFYLKAVRLPVPATATQIIKTGFPSIFLHKDTLHYIYTSYQDIGETHEGLPAIFDAINNGVFAEDESQHDIYYHHEVNGFNNADYIENSFWLKDDNGLYYLSLFNTFFQVSENPYKTHHYDENSPNYLRTEKTLFGVYFDEVAEFSLSAEIVSDELVIDNNTVFYKGKELENSDAASFVTFGSDFLDKNFYYDNLNPHRHRYPLPHWAYEELISGSIEWRDLSDIKMSYAYTSYKKYWNGFLVTMKVPTKKNPDRKLQITFKNIERKTLQFDRALEEILHLFYRKEYKDSDELSAPLISTTPYNHQEIEPDKTIEFTLELPAEVTSINGEVFSYPYFIALSSNNEWIPERTTYRQLHIESKVDLTEQSPER